MKSPSLALEREIGALAASLHRRRTSAGAGKDQSEWYEMSETFKEPKLCSGFWDANDLAIHARPSAN